MPENASAPRPVVTKQLRLLRPCSILSPAGSVPGQCHKPPLGKPPPLPPEIVARVVALICKQMVDHHVPASGQCSCFLLRILHGSTHPIFVQLARALL